MIYFGVKNNFICRGSYQHTKGAMGATHQRNMSSWEKLNDIIHKIPEPFYARDLKNRVWIAKDPKVSRWTAGTIETIYTKISGTVLNPGSTALIKAFMELFKRHGISLTREEATKSISIGLDTEDCFKHFIGVVRPRWKLKHDRELSQDDEIRLKSEFDAIHLELLEQLENSEPLTGIPELFKSLRKEGFDLVAKTESSEPLNKMYSHAIRNHGIPLKMTDEKKIGLGSQNGGIFLQDLDFGKLHRDHTFYLTNSLDSEMETMFTGVLTLPGLGLSEEELNELPLYERQWLHEKVAHEALNNGAHCAFACPKDAIIALSHTIGLMKLGYRARDYAPPLIRQPLNYFRPITLL